NAKTCAAVSPCVSGLTVALRSFEIAVIEVLPVGTIKDIVPCLAARLPENAVVDIVSGRCAEKIALSVLRLFSDDVNDAVDGVGSPQCPAGTPDELDPFDVLERKVLQFPVGARKERIVQRPAVDHDQKLVGEAFIKAADVDRPAVGIALRYI